MFLSVPGFCEEFTFSGDMLSRNKSQANVLSVPDSVPADSETAVAPELAYENYVRAKVWKHSGLKESSSNLSAGFSEAKFQGQRNVCNAFATSALAEYLVWRKDNSKPDFSEEFLYYNTKYKFCDTPDLDGYKSDTGLPGYAVVLALKGGVVKESEWPFLAKLPPHTAVPPLTDPDLGTPPDGIQKKVLDYSFAPEAVRRSDIKYFLAQEKRPVVVNLMLYFGNVNNSTGELKQPSAEQRQQCMAKRDNCGGHVVLLTGYDPETKTYIFRNSWGAGWGKSGYGSVSEAYVMQDCESCGELTALPGLNDASRSLMVNAAYGWSAVLK